MSSGNQQVITIHISLKSCPGMDVMRLTLDGRDAQFFKRLLAAGEAGIPRSDIPPNTIMRLEEFGLKFVFFNTNLAGIGKPPTRVKLSLDSDFVMRLSWPSDQATAA